MSRKIFIRDDDGNIVINQRVARNTLGDMLLASGALSTGALGTGLVSHGLYDIARPLRIGVTGGSKPVWGQGHIVPAKGIRDILKTVGDVDLIERTGSGSKDFIVTRSTGKGDKILTNPTGKIKGNIPKVYDLLADTGMGYTNPHEGSPAAFKLKVKAGGYVPVMTDLRKWGNPLESGALDQGRQRLDWRRRAEFRDYEPGLGGHIRRVMSRGGIRIPFTDKKVFNRPDTFMYYGDKIDPETAKTLRNKVGVRAVRVGKHMSPTLNKDVMDYARNMNALDVPAQKEIARQSLIQFTEGQLADTRLPSHQRAMYEHTLDELRNAKGKHIWTVVGSGRGDQVVSRTNEILDNLSPEQRKKSLVIPVLAGGMGAPPEKGGRLSTPEQMRKGTVLASDKFVRQKGVAALGFVPQKEYLNAQYLADDIAASTGTSSFMESTVVPRRLHIPQSMRKYQEVDKVILKKTRSRIDSAIGNLVNMPEAQVSKLAKKGKLGALEVAVSAGKKGRFKTLSRLRGLTGSYMPDVDSWNSGNKSHFVDHFGNTIKRVFSFGGSQAPVDDKALRDRSDKLLADAGKSHSAAGKIFKKLVAAQRKRKLYTGLTSVGGGLSSVGASAMMLSSLINRKRQRASEEKRRSFSGLF